MGMNNDGPREANSSFQGDTVSHQQSWPRPPDLLGSGLELPSTVETLLSNTASEAKPSEIPYLAVKMSQMSLINFEPLHAAGSLSQ